jgi:predicted nucleic-acid-binding Zn-ribbon protein
MSSDSTGSDDEPAYVYCNSCGAKASTSWSFCRSCQSSLEDATPPEDAEDVYDEAPAFDEESGCPKCGHDEAEVDEIATTGSGLSRLFDFQNRTFSVVSCTRCGYCEFYRSGDADVILDLFIGG